MTQSYTVYVPLNEMIEGRSVVRLRTEERSRQVEVIKRVRAPKVETVERNYTVFVPYSFELKDGRKVTRARMETRSRRVPVDEPEIDYVPCYVIDSFPLSKLKCMDTAGKRLTYAQVNERLAEPKPVIFINDDSWLTPYFRELLKPETMLILRKVTQPARKKK